jgi:DNA-binding PadR family transcriptional regulator
MTAPPQHRPPFSRRITESVTCVLLLLLAEPDREWYGTELSARVPCHASTVLRILRDLTYAGWTTERESTAHRGPARYYHRLTETGITEATRALRRQYPNGIGLALLATAAGLSLDAVDLDLSGRR